MTGKLKALINKVINYNKPKPIKFDYRTIKRNMKYCTKSQLIFLICKLCEQPETQVKLIQYAREVLK